MMKKQIALAGSGVARAVQHPQAQGRAAARTALDALTGGARR